MLRVMLGAYRLLTGVTEILGEVGFIFCTDDMTFSK